MSTINVAGSRVQCATAEGAAYVKKVVHPPSPLTPIYSGTPFRGNSQIALLELKGETDIPPIFNYNTGTLQAPEYHTINPTTLLFLTPSGGRVGSYSFMRVAEDTYVQQIAANIDIARAPLPSVPAALLSGYDFVTQYSHDFSCHRIGYKSTTFYLNATAFNNQGTVASAKFKPNIITSNTDVPEYRGNHKTRSHHHHAHAYYESLPPADRHAFLQASKANLTCDYSLVEEDGYVTDADGNPTIPFPEAYLQVHNFGESRATIADIGGIPAIQGLLPNTISDIQMLSKSAVMRPACEGAYVVQSNSDDVNLFIQAPITERDGAVPMLVQCYFVWFNPALGKRAYFQLRASQSTILDTDVFSYQDIPWTGHDWSFTMFQGLTVPTSPISSNNGLPYISVKTILGLEIQPRVSSSMRPFMRELPMPDEAALDLASILIRERPDCMPAAANDFGQIFSAIADYAPKVVSWISKAFGGNSAKPATDNKKTTGKWLLGDIVDELVNPKPSSAPKTSTITTTPRRKAAKSTSAARSTTVARRTTGRRTKRNPPTDLATAMANMAIRRKRIKPTPNKPRV